MGEDAEVTDEMISAVEELWDLCTGMDVNRRNFIRQMLTVALGVRALTSACRPQDS
jgi:hypothetical protein